MYAVCCIHEQEMYKAFARESKHTGNDRLLLTMAVSGGSYYINLAYEPRKIGKYDDDKKNLVF